MSAAMRLLGLVVAVGCLAVLVGIARLAVGIEPAPAPVAALEAVPLEAAEPVGVVVEGSPGATVVSVGGDYIHNVAIGSGAHSALPTHNVAVGWKAVPR